MEAKNGIIINGMFHETVSENISCDKCSLLRLCKELDEEHYIYLCTLMHCNGFANRGRVKVEKEK